MFSFQRFTFVCPGEAIFITPPYPQLNWQPDVKHTLPPIDTFVFSAVHEPAIVGMQVDGVSTPNAAAVAAETAGLLIDVHAGNGGILVTGAQSLIVAAGDPDVTEFI